MQTVLATRPDVHEQERRLRGELQDALRRGDARAARSVCRRLDDLYVSQAHVRAADPEVRRLRRQVREAAA